MTLGLLGCVGPLYALLSVLLRFVRNACLRCRFLSEPVGNSSADRRLLSHLRLLTGLLGGRWHFDLMLGPHDGVPLFEVPHDAPSEEGR